MCKRVTSDRAQSQNKIISTIIDIIAQLITDSLDFDAFFEEQ